MSGHPVEVVPSGASDKVMMVAAGSGLGTWAAWHLWLKSASDIASLLIPLFSLTLLVLALAARVPSVHERFKAVFAWLGRNLWKVGIALLTLLGVLALLTWLSSAKAAPAAPAQASMSARKRKSADDAGDEGDVDAAAAPSGSKLYDFALTYLGTREALPNGKPNPVVKAMGEATPAFKNFNPVRDPWCAIGLNFFLKSIGWPTTNSAMARSFLNWCHPTNDPRLGDIVVFWRGSRDDGITGHVGIVKSVSTDWVEVLGCNQGDAVSIAKFRRSRVLGFRRYQSLMRSKQVAALAVTGAGTAGAAAGTAHDASNSAPVPEPVSVGEQIENVRGPLSTLAEYMPGRIGLYIAAACTALAIAGVVWALYERSGYRQKIGW